MPSTQITITGNLTDAPDLRFTPSGAPVATFTVAVNERYRDNSGTWQDGETSFHRVNAWRELAEHATESLGKGDRVIVTGTLRQRNYENKDGDKRTVWEVRAAAIGADLTRAVVKITRVKRNGVPLPEDPWASAPAPTGADDNSEGFSGEPPF
jgi:single-strand DNA-binding protein